MRHFTLNLLLLIAVSAFGQTPTVPASNLVFTFTGCNEVTIEWTSGNGDTRLVFMREGSGISDVPQNNEFYSSSNIFGQGESTKNDNTNYCVYRGSGNSFTVKGLKNTTKYCIGVFEYNSGAGTYNYKTDTYPTDCITTKNIVAAGYLYDSRRTGQSGQCLTGNSFQFKNKSTCDLSPLTYSWKFGDGDTSNLTEPKHTYKTAGIKQVILIARAPGCYGSNTFNDTVYPQPLARFDLEPNDTIQCWYNNFFTFKNKSTLADIGTGLSAMRYEWYEVPSPVPFSDGYKANYTSKTDGPKTIKLVAVSNIGCRDSTFRYYKIKPRAVEPTKISISPKSMPLKNNKFTFTNTDTKTWRLFSKTNSTFKDSIRGTSVNYTFKTIGWYYISFDTTDANTGCYDKYTDSVEVKQDVGIWYDKAFTPISIYPNPSKSGIFNIYNLPPDAFIKVFNIVGQDLINLTPKQSKTEINLTDFGAGTYILSLWSEGRKFDYRLVVL